jgi:hypothetical protein
LRYDSKAHQDVEAYAWSWAAVIFLKNHPDTSKAFAEMLQQKKMTSDQTITRALLRKLQGQWPQIRREWNAMLTELEYGYDPGRGMLAMTRIPKSIGDTPVTLKLAVDRSWQTPGVKVAEGDTITITTSGEFSVCDKPKPWRCQADGVTLEYYRSEPLGKLMMTLASSFDEEQFSQPIEVIPVGEHSEYTAKQAGELHFRINESNGGLSDNAGVVTIKVQKK